MRGSRIFFALLASVCCLAQKRDADFSRLADRCFDEYMFKFDPVAGTQAGFHQYDALLPAGSHSEIDAQVAILKKFEAEVEGFGAQGLSTATAADRDLLLSAIRSQLLSLEVVRPWEKNPDVYSSGVSNAIFVVMSRSFAPAAVRLRSVIAREKLIPQVFQSARANLKNQPKIYTEVELEQLHGLGGF